MRNLESVEVIDTSNGTSRRSLFRKALAAAAAVAGAGALLDVNRRTARAADGDPLTVGNTALLGPDTSSNTTQLDKDDLNAGPTLVLTNQNGAGLDSTGSGVGSIGRGGTWGVEGVAPVGVVGVGMGAGSTGVRGTSSADNGFGVVGATFGPGTTGVLGTAAGGGNQGVRGEGPRGVLGVGTGAGGTGVLGQAGVSGKEGVRGEGPTGVVGVGVRGVEGQGSQSGVVGNGRDAGSAGVFGVSEAPTSTGVSGQGTFTGVFGLTLGSRGVEGQGAQFGVLGFGTADNSIGVAGASTAANSIGVQGRGTQKGVIGYGRRGVEGQGTSDGVIGFGDTGVSGVSTLGDAGIGVYCGGRFLATGTKTAAVPHPDGSYRLLYCMESPECWFEDFGRGVLVGGRASVTLDPDFAAVVNTTDYYVFLTPEGDSRGLYVSGQSTTGFTVHEQQGGTGSLRFSYRVVARRKDVAAERLAKFSLPALPIPTDVGSAPEPTRTPDLPLLKPSQVSAPPPAGSGRR